MNKELKKRPKKIKVRAFKVVKGYPYVEIYNPFWETIKEEDNGYTITYYQKEKPH